MKIKGDPSPARLDVYDIETLAQPDRSKSVSSKRRTTPLKGVSPVREELGRLVPLRLHPHVSLNAPKDGCSKISESNDGDHLYKTEPHRPPQKLSSESRLASTAPTRDISSSKKAGRSSRDAQGDLIRSRLSEADSAKEVAAKVNSPQDGQFIGSEPENEERFNKAYLDKGAQKHPRALPWYSPTASNTDKKSGKKYGEGLRAAQDDVTPNSLRIAHSGKKVAAEAGFKRGSPARAPPSKISKRTTNSPKPPSSELVNHESPQPNVAVLTTGPQRSREATLRVMEKPTADLNLSAAVQDDTNLQVPHAISPLLHQQEPGSAFKEGPDARIVETNNTGDPMNRADGNKASRPASCTGNEPSQGTREARVPPRHKKIIVKDEQEDCQSSSLRIDQARVGSPIPQASEISIESIGSLATPRRAVVNGTKTMVTALVAEQPLPSNIEGGLATDPTIDLRVTVSASDMERCMRRHMKELHDNHEYFMKVRARHSCYTEQSDGW